MFSMQAGKWPNDSWAPSKPRATSSDNIRDWARRGGFTHPRLRDWRFFVVFRPFKKYVLFYEIVGEEVIMRRAMHGHRDLPGRLLEPPPAS